jgi:all-trans-retinol dehydrogenase (NAD+)
MTKKNHGHIVTIASTGSFYSQAQNVSYACSKAAAMAFHEGLGQELRARFDAPRIRTSYVSLHINHIIYVDCINNTRIIYPDFVRTPLVEALTSKVSKFPLNVLEPGDVAKEVIDVILSTYSHSIILPRSMAYLALLRGLPLWVQRTVQTLDPDPLALANR